MKHLIIALGMSCMLLVVSAQQPPRLKSEDLQVRDSTGKLYPTETWQKLVFAGQYKIQLAPDRKTGLLVKLSEEEEAAILLKIPRPRPSMFFTTGEAISPFSEKDITGIKFDLRKLVGKVVVLNFWFINCGPCRMEMPELNKLVAQYKDNNDVVFLAVALDPRYEILDFLKTTPFNYHIIDDGRFIAGKYGVTSYPTHVILDRSGKVLFHTTGYAMNTISWVKKSIQSALDNKPLE